MFRHLFRSLPHGIRGDLEVLEGTAPRFHRVCSDPRVPVQLVDGEVSMLDRWQNRRKLHILHMGGGPEFQPVESHRHTSGYPAPESTSKKIRNFEATVVDSIAATAGQPGRMKNIIG